ncbi:unnamed protein product [Symbiodinium natans]|uniref:inosine/xanthosine triphosphatase n=1 Tax=Symbiodinium natans TaxID=878477 RepID=A0A812IZX9_9DINO|nr:unnamed protein product [Symbiodinium natans]
MRGQGCVGLGWSFQARFSRNCSSSCPCKFMASVFKDAASAFSCTVAVTSANPDKLAAIESAFSSHFAKEGRSPSISVVPCPADSGIPHGQPWGMQHTYEGALARLANLKSSGATADYYASAENGVCALLRHDSTMALDVACVIVERACDGKQGVNFSQGRPYPLQEIQKMKCAGSSNAEIGDFCQRWYEKMALPLSRQDQIRTAAALALTLVEAEAHAEGTAPKMP